MTKRKAASVRIFNKKRGLHGYRYISTGTGTGTATKDGIIHVDGVTAGLVNAQVYISVDTAGTGTQIDA